MGQTTSKNTKIHKNKRKSISKLFHAQTGSIWFQIGSYLVPIGSYGSIVHRSVPTNLKWLPNCSHAHALFQDRFKDVQVGSRWFNTLYILSPNFYTSVSWVFSFLLSFSGWCAGTCVLRPVISFGLLWLSLCGLCAFLLFCFFSSNMTDAALWLGPYMSISSKNAICTRAEKARKCRQITTNQPSHRPARRPTNPSQTCVSSKETARKKGKSPNKNTHKRICHRTQWSDHCITLSSCWCSVVLRVCVGFGGCCFPSSVPLRVFALVGWVASVWPVLS